MDFADLMHRLPEMKSRGPVNVEFKDGIVVLECYPEKGVRGEIVDITVNEHDVLKMTVDYTKFDEYNKAFETHDYFDKAGKACLTAREAGYYTTVETIYVTPTDEVDKYFTIIGDDRSALYVKYIESKSEVPYVQWLETLVIEHAIP